MQPKFVDVLESVEALPTSEREMLVEIVRNRIIEERRSQLRSDIDDSRREFEAGMCREMSPDEIMDEVLS